MNTINTNVNICGVDFTNPIVLASGTVGYGAEMNEFFPISNVGAVTLKAVTVKPRTGNPPNRIAECKSAIINAIGLANKGLDYFESDIMPEVNKLDTIRIANVAGESVEEYVAICDRLNKHDAISMYEINVSCPNVAAGGMVFGCDRNVLERLIKECKAVSQKPVIIKLHPDLFNISTLAKLCEDCGADAISLTNTVPAMEIDPISERPKIYNNFGGMSGEAIRPIALRLVYLASKAVSIPVIGGGGVSHTEDIVKFMLAGASLVSIGTLAMTDPMKVYAISQELPKYLEQKKVGDIKDIIGRLELFS